MAQTYSTDLRVRFVRAVAAGTSARAAGRRFEIAPTTAIRWARAWRERGEHRARPRGRPPKGSKLDRHEGFLLALLEQQRDITLREAAERPEEGDQHRLPPDHRLELGPGHPHRPQQAELT